MQIASVRDTTEMETTGEMRINGVRYTGEMRNAGIQDTGEIQNAGAHIHSGKKHRCPGHG